MTSPDAPHRALLDTIDTQRLGCELAGSSLYADVLEAIAADVGRSGPSFGVLGPSAGARFGDAILLRLLAGLHALVLDGRAPDLASHYPSAGGTPGSPLRLAAAVVDTIGEHAGWLDARMAHGVQTNEVGRSASMLGGFLEIGRLGLPLRVYEVGASAGLNLLFDRYRYVTSTSSWGPHDARLVFHEPWSGRSPDLGQQVHVAERAGCDVDPVDVGHPDGRLLLRSFVWADQLDRLDRLDAAIEVARYDPPRVEAASAPDWIERRLATPAPGHCTVVAHSIVLQYLSVDDRARFLDVVDQAGAAATDDAPLAWLRLEPGGDRAELRLTVWPGGATGLLATSSFHGPPVVWRATAGGVSTATRSPGSSGGR